MGKTLSPSSQGQSHAQRVSLQEPGVMQALVDALNTPALTTLSVCGPPAPHFPHTSLNLLVGHLGRELKSNKTLTTLTLDCILLFSLGILNEAHIKALAEALVRNHTLTSLDIQIEAGEGVRRFADAMADNNTLQNLTLRGMITHFYHTGHRIGDLGAGYVAQMLSRNAVLTSLDLTSLTF